MKGDDLVFRGIVEFLPDSAQALPGVDRNLFCATGELLTEGINVRNNQLDSTAEGNAES